MYDAFVTLRNDYHRGWESTGEFTNEDAAKENVAERTYDQLYWILPYNHTTYPKNNREKLHQVLQDRGPYNWTFEEGEKDVSYSINIIK